MRIGQTEKTPGGELSSGGQFVEKINALMESAGEEGRMPAANPASLGPIFDETISELKAKGKDLNAPTVMLATHLHMYDDLKSKKATWPSEYFVEETVRGQTLGEISKFINEHPELKNKFEKLEVK